MSGGTERRFNAYIDDLARILRHEDRYEPFKAYCRGLLLPGQRKSIEPMAARVDPTRVSALHQALHHLVAKASWSDEALLAGMRRLALGAAGPLQAWVVGELAFSKKGQHSVGVARQYSAELGRNDNCQLMVMLSAAGTVALPLAMRLFLPTEWATDPGRRAKTGIPKEIGYQRPGEIALALIRDRLAEAVPGAPIVAGATYGADPAFRQGLGRLDLPFLVEVPAATPIRTGQHGPIAAGELARGLPVAAWRTGHWLEKGVQQAGRIALIEAWPAEDQPSEDQPSEDRPEGQPPEGQAPADQPTAPDRRLLILWPADAEAPSGYWTGRPPALSPERLAQLVDRVDWTATFYRQFRQKLGLDHYEGRGWRGVHHHAALWATALGFLLLEETRQPVAAGQTAWALPELDAPSLPADFAPRGAATPGLHRHGADSARRSRTP